MLFSSALTGIIIPFILIHTLKEKRALVAVTIIPVNTIIKTKQGIIFIFQSKSNPKLRLAPQTAYWQNKASAG